MSLIREPNTRQSVFADAMVAVMAVGRDHSIMQISAEADRLIEEHPGCPVSVGELREYLVRFAVREHVPMVLG
jgi:hypothetical protein